MQQTNKPLYALTSDAWERLQQTLPHFETLFALVEQGHTFDDEEYQAVAQVIWNILGIRAGAELSEEAWARICPCAQFARGLLAVCQTDGVYTLYRVTCH